MKAAVVGSAATCDFGAISRRVDPLERDQQPVRASRRHGASSGRSTACSARCAPHRSRPATLLFWAKTCVLDAPARLGPDCRPSVDESPVQRARRRLVMKLDERVVGCSERPGENRHRSQRRTGDERPAGERCGHEVLRRSPSPALPRIIHPVGRCGRPRHTDGRL